MIKPYLLTGIFGIAIIFLSNSANPPDGHTGAPGETLCTSCHSLNGTPNLGTISVEGFPASITPEQIYKLTVVNRNTNDGAVKGGFQMTILGPNNTKAGDFTLPSANSIIANSGGRQYFEHHPAVVYPDSNVVKWTVEWKAPILASGSQITWYASGNIANGNSQSTGDRVVTAKGSGLIVLAGTEELLPNITSIYPNPGSDEIHINLENQPWSDGRISFFDMSGRKVGDTEIVDGMVSTRMLTSGVYLLRISNSEREYVMRWSKF